MPVSYTHLDVYKRQARIDYSLVLDIDSDNQEALLMRAYIYMRQRNYNFAKSDYERLLKLAHQSYNCILYTSRCV